MNIHRLLMFLWMAILALSACDSRPEALKVDISGDDLFRFDPAAVRVAAGERVKLTFENGGSLNHTWTLVAADVELVTVSADDVQFQEAHTDIVPGGTSKTITFTAPEAGEYKYVCIIPGHAAAGMVGTFSVE